MILRFCFASFFMFCAILTQAQKDKVVRQTYQFTFENKVADSILELGKMYQNQFGERFSVRRFAYYISHIKLTYTNDEQYAVKEGPHLVSEADSLSKIVSFTAPAGTIATVSFLLGIDSLTNVSGVQTGDLDPAKGMFWVWNTGYIMAKLEGTSPQSKAPARQYSYDVGGFKRGEDATRNITLSLPKKLNRQISNITITADANKWFSGENNIKISEQPMCHQPGKLAMQIADNYAAMFSISLQ